MQMRESGVTERLMNQAKVTQLASDGTEMKEREPCGMENNSKWVDYLWLRVVTTLPRREEI